MANPSFRLQKPKLVGKTKLVVANLSFAELGTAQPQLVSRIYGISVFSVKL